MPSVLQLLSWYAVIQLAGTLSWPIAWRLFSALPDRGYAFTKHLGILLTGMFLWLGCAYGLLPNEEGGAWIALAALAAASLAFAREGLRKDLNGSRPLVRWLKDHMAQVVWAEGLFLAAFAFWVWVRACDPSIGHTEQPMDLMFLSAIHASPVFPPRDAWLAGYSISYYYLGYWLLSTLAFLAGQAAEVAYNLGQASWFALLLLGSFGVGSNLMRLILSGSAQRSARTRRWGMSVGLVSAAAVGLIGNLEFLLEWLNRRGTGSRLIAWFAVEDMPQSQTPPDGWWWWWSSRVLSDHDLMGRPIEVIDEFPFFSYLLGDNHPHLLSMPFLLLLLGITLNIITTQARTKENSEELSFSRWRMPLDLDLPSFTLLSISLAGLALLNTWDLVPGILLITLVVLSRESAKAGNPSSVLLRTLAFGGLLALSVSVLVWPFLASVQSSVTGPRPNFFHPTRLAQFVLMFGTLIPGIIALFWHAWRENRPTPRGCLVSLASVWGAIAAAFSVGILWGFMTSPGREWLDQVVSPLRSSGHLHEMLRRWFRDPFTLMVLSLALALGVSLLTRSIRATSVPAKQNADSARESATVFALILAVVGILILSLPELFYLQDSFGTRMNTVFKLYYEAWLLIAIASALGCGCALQAGKGGRAVAALGFLALATGLIYPAAALKSKVWRGGVCSGTFDGIAHFSKDELEAVQWIRANVPKTAVVAEGVGASYRSETNRMSAATGRCTPLGWPGHEVQWRGAAYPAMAGGREGALEAIYGSATGTGLQALLRASHIDYLYLGPAERTQYKITPTREQQLEDTLRVVFQSGAIRIYRPRF